MKEKIVKIGLVCLGSLSVLISCFANAGLTTIDSITQYGTLNDKSYTNSNADMICIKGGETCQSEITVMFNFDHGYNARRYIANGQSIGNGNLGFCGLVNTLYYTTQTNNTNCPTIITAYKFTEYTEAQCKSTYNLISPSECSVMSSLQCQTNYNLIPINSVDSEYCETNNLCSSQSCPDNPVAGTSNLYINDIFHPGAFNIVVNIPEEIDWDYAYTNSGLNFNLDVVGYNQDTEYINSVIDVQNYKPTSEDFSKVFGLFSNYSGLLIACLFIILVFYFVKKLFK